MQKPWIAEKSDSDRKWRIKSRMYSKRKLRNKSYVTYGAYILRQILDKRILNKQTSSQHGNSFETNSKSYYVISNRFNIEELSSRFNIHRDQGKNNWSWLYWHCEPNSRLCNHFPTGTFNRNTQAGMVKMVSKQLLQNTVVICIYTCQEDSNISSI